MVTHVDGEVPQVAPVGFVLWRERLITVRFAALPAFDAIAGRFDDSGRRPTSSLEVLVDLCDEIVDRLADSLEPSATELRTLSASAFHVPDSGGRKAIRSNRVIRGQLRHVGRLGTISQRNVTSCRHWGVPSISRVR